MIKYSFCEKCTLIDRPIVFGQIGTRKDIILIGEAPGATEVRLGIPFVGRAGQLLNEVLAEIGVDRNSLYISNSCICWPVNENGNNRAPTDLEISCCNDRLLKSIAKINPNIIVTLGSRAFYALVPTTEPIKMSELVGDYFMGKNYIRVFCIYHPSFIMRNNEYRSLFKKHLEEVFKNGK